MTSCFHCGKKIERGDKVKMVALDIPYINLFFCRPDCWITANVPNLNTYLVQNIERVYNIRDKSNKKGKK